MAYNSSSERQQEMGLSHFGKLVAKNKNVV